MIDKTLSYDDLPLAAFLILSGFRLLQVKDNPQRPGLSVFIFAHDEKIAQVVANFYMNRGMVEPRKFLLLMRDLKQGRGIGS